MNTSGEARTPAPLGLAVLCLLAYEPMHPYRIQQLIKLWGKDLVVYVGQRKTLYTTIDRLVRDGLVEVSGRSRQTGFPERTTYQLTERGHAACRFWLRGMLATPKREYPQFPAAVSFLLLLPPEEVLVELVTRQAAIEDELARLDQIVADAGPAAARVSLLELEYLRAVTTAERKWLAEIVDDLRSGRLTWNEDTLRSTAALASEHPQEEERT